MRHTRIAAAASAALFAALSLMASAQAVQSRAAGVGRSDIGSARASVMARTYDIGAMGMPEGYSDADDEDSLPYLLTAHELLARRLQPKPQTFTVSNPAVLKAVLRRTPVRKVRIHAVRTANTDKSDAATITPADISKLVAQANVVWYASGIEFVFDPAKDFEHRNNTNLNQDCQIAGLTVHAGNPNWNPGSVNKAPNVDARAAVGKQYPDKLVVFFRWGTKFTWDEAAKAWKRGPATGGFSSANSMFVAMPRKLPEKNLLAHEVGHYLHLPHTFVGGIATVDDAAKAIRDWVDVKGGTTQTALNALDGDRAAVTDSPPDARGAIFIAKYGDGANCDPKYPSVQIPVRFKSGYQAYYTLEPDRLNIMSYFKGCHALGTHRLSKQQIDRARNALEQGNRKPLIGL